MADNFVTNPGTGGPAFASDDVGGVHYPRAKSVWGVDGSAADTSLVAPLPVQPAATSFVFSASGQNTTTTQLAPGATFTGTIESTQSQQTISILLTCDQPSILYLNQFIDAAGAFKTNSFKEVIPAGTQFSEAYTANGNYFQAILTNTGTGVTTTLNLNTAYGTLPAVSSLGNNLSAINEVNGVNFFLGKNTAANSLPVTIATDSVVTITDPQMLGAQSSDAPLFVAIAGDPNGDFAGVNLIESLMDEGSGFSANVRVVNPPLLDLNRATVLSDAPKPITLAGQIGAVFVIDTTGYQSLGITTGAGFAGTVTASDDGINYSALTGTPRILGTYVTAVTATAGFSFPCISRYIKITLTTAGAATAYLRAQPWNANYTTSVPTGTPTAPTLNAVNLTQIGGTAQTAGGLALNSLASTNGQSISQTIITATAAAVVQVKASAGRITMLAISNGAANAGYLHLQNNAAATTATASVMTFAIPATAGGIVVVKLPEGGLYLSAGIAYTVSGAIASADTTALTAPSIAVNISFI